MHTCLLSLEMTHLAIPDLVMPADAHLLGAGEVDGVAGTGGQFRAPEDAAWRVGGDPRKLLRLDAAPSR